MSSGMERTPLTVEEPDNCNESGSSQRAGMTVAAEACWQVWH